MYNRMIKRFNVFSRKFFYIVTFPYWILYYVYAVVTNYYEFDELGVLIEDTDGRERMLNEKHSKMDNFWRKHIALPYIITVR